MASFSSSSPSSVNIYTVRLLQLSLFSLIFGSAFAHLAENYYLKSCPQALSIIESGVKAAICKEARMGASLMRLHFHDCLISGCDASILLDDPIFGEKKALPNYNSARGFEVIDDIKTELERACPGVVSCSDILAVVARDSITTLGGPSWKVKLGRKDGRQAHGIMANGAVAILLGPLKMKLAAFASKGFTTEDYVALNGGHTVGMSQCKFYKKRIHDKGDNIDPKFAEALQQQCPSSGGDNNTAPIDLTTPYVFDNAYFTNLIHKKGLLDSDQELYTGKGGETDSLVKKFSSNKDKFFDSFVRAFVKLGNLGVITKNNGEVRTDCRRVNKHH